MGGSPRRFTSPFWGRRGSPPSIMVRFDLGGRSPSHSPENGPEAGAVFLRVGTPGLVVGEPLVWSWGNPWFPHVPPPFARLCAADVSGAGEADLGSGVYPSWPR